MKKLLLSITVVVAGYAAYGQVVCAGVSPASIQGNYDYGNQAGSGAWPGETDDGTWGVINNLDFNVPGTFIQDTLMLVEDGTPGLNAQGHPISQEGCNPLINDLTGKIAVIYRNTCNFTAKLLNAQNAGAVAAIIVNREDALISMLGDATEGIQVTIPAVFLNNIDGNALIAEMQNGPVVMFIGNKIGAFADDLGALTGEFLISPFGGNNSQIFDGFETGIQVYNYGNNDQPNATVNASIDGPSGNVYDETVAIPLNAGDTAFIFPGNATEFPPFDLGGVGNYPNGNYTLTYTISNGANDDFPFDNVYVAEFKVADDILSSSRLTAGNLPVANSYPSNSTTEYQSCWMVQEPNIDGMITTGLWIVPHTDTAVNTLAGAEIFVNAYQWDDGWIDLNDPNYTFDPTTNDAFQNLNLLTFGTHYPASDDDVNDPAFVTFGQPLTLQNDVRYLFCAQTFESTTISFGYDNALDYGGNYGIFAQPISPVFVDGQWYAAGWSGTSAPAMALHQSHLGLDEADVLVGNVFPNPANDFVTVSVQGEGDAVLSIVDVAGKVVYNETVTLNNGQVKVNVAGFEAGVYMFNISLENGKSAQFNVIKK